MELPENQARKKRMAEGAGFEPARLLAYPLSRRAHSTTMRPLRALGGNRTPDSGLRTPQLYPLSYEGE